MIRNKFFAASVLAFATLAGTAAIAQTSTTPAPSTTPPAVTPAPSGATRTDPATTGSTSAAMLPRVDATTLKQGYRTSKVVGTNVVNAANETIGEVDDLIIAPGAKEPYAIVSVGGFLGIGDKLVVVPYSSFSMNNERLVLAGATKDSLKNLPEYTYAP